VPTREASSSTLRLCLCCCCRAAGSEPGCLPLPAELERKGADCAEEEAEAEEARSFQELEEKKVGGAT
jgi:hypothetical protein